MSFFQTNKEKLDGEDDGRFRVSEEAITAGVKGVEGKYLKNPYQAFWDTNKSLLSIIIAASSDEMSDEVKVTSIKKLAYILDDNYADFENVAQGEDMIELYSLFSEALESIKNKEKHVETINKIKESLNTTAKSIEGYYGIEMEGVK